MIQPLSFIGEFRKLGVGDKDETRIPDKCDMRVRRQERTRQ